MGERQDAPGRQGARLPSSPLLRQFRSPRAKLRQSGCSVGRVRSFMRQLILALLVAPSVLWPLRPVAEPVVFEVHQTIPSPPRARCSFRNPSETPPTTRPRGRLVLFESCAWFVRRGHEGGIVLSGPLAEISWPRASPRRSIGASRLADVAAHVEALRIPREGGIRARGAMPPPVGEVPWPGNQ